MKMKHTVAAAICISLILAAVPARPAFALWGSSEMETEKVSVTFAREVGRGGYQTMTAAELKTALDQKKDMPIIVIDRFLPALLSVPIGLSTVEPIHSPCR